MKLNKNESNFEIIKAHALDPESNIALNDLQAKLLERWNFYIGLRLGGKIKTAAIVKLMMERFGIERSTVYNDMGFAESLFGFNSTLDKRFRMGARINFLEDKLQELYDAEAIDEEGEKINRYDLDYLNGRLKVAAALEKVLFAYYRDYPELRQKQSPRKLIFNIIPGDLKTEDLPANVQDAIDLIDKQLPPSNA